MGDIGWRIKRNGGSGSARLALSSEHGCSGRCPRPYHSFHSGAGTRVDARATRVTETDTRYISTEADSVNKLAAVPDPVTGV
jgi:hypothetical protein